TVLGNLATGLEPLWQPPGPGCRPQSHPTVDALGPVIPVAGEDRAPAGKCEFERGCSCRGVAAASDPGIRPAGLGCTAASQSRATAVATLGRGTRGTPGPRPSGGPADGVRVVGEHGGSPQVCLCGCLPESDGVEPGGTQERDLPGAVAD